MCKKVGFLAAVAVVGMLVISQTRVGSYVGTAWDRAWTKASKKIPPEFQIERARHLANKLVDDIEKQKAVVAEETVVLREMTAKVESARVAVDSQKKALAQRRTQLDSGIIAVKDGGRAADTEEKLGRDYKTWTLMEDELKSREKLLDLQEQKKAQAEKHLTILFGKQKELQVRINQAELKLNELRLRQSANNSDRGDDTVAEINAILNNVEHDVEVRSVREQLDQQYNTTPKAAEPAVDANEMRERLGVSKPNKVVRGDE